MKCPLRFELKMVAPDVRANPRGVHYECANGKAGVGENGRRFCCDLPEVVCDTLKRRWRSGESQRTIATLGECTCIEVSLYRISAALGNVPHCLHEDTHTLTHACAILPHPPLHTSVPRCRCRVDRRGRQNTPPRACRQFAIASCVA